MNLFQKQRFQMHSGGYSDFKLECDALTTKDWETLAFLVSRNLNFKEVHGIPSGGIPFAEALKPYASANSETILIADDVFTTGGSVKEFKAKLLEQGYKEKNIKTIVAFSRGNHDSKDVKTIFSLNEEYWQND